MTKAELKKKANQYVKYVDWSDEDQCFIGRCPELFGGGTHGSDEGKVYATLCELVEEFIEDFEKMKMPLPKSKIPNDRKYSGKFLIRTGAELHKALAIRAFKEHKSLNEVCVEALQHAH